MRGPNGDEIHGELTGGSSGAAFRASGTLARGLDGNNAPVIATCRVASGFGGINPSLLENVVAPPACGNRNTNARAYRWRDNIFSQPDGMNATTGAPINHPVLR